MILKASQRGGGKQLAQHLLRSDDNEHVAVHEIRGFQSRTLTAALKEAYAVSQATNCRQFLFSVSLNPPQDKQVAIETFENVIERIEHKNGLSGQPRAIVFHEKEGRRHAHAVWSRIDAETMTARNLPHFKMKLRDLSREVYLEQGWQLPKGLMNSQQRDPRNFTLSEWQQARREGVHARELKEMMAECWAASDSRKAFSHALEERGMMLARGDRRGHVAVSHTGNVLSVARYAGQKAKDVRARLGTADDLPSADEAKAKLATQMQEAVRRHINEANALYKTKMAPLEQERRKMTDLHRAERLRLTEKQQQRWQQESRERAARLAKGLPGLWQRVSGEHKMIRAENERAAYAALQRDRDQQHRLIWVQLAERRGLQARIKDARREHAELLLKLRGDRQHHRGIVRDAEQSLAKAYGRSATPQRQSPRTQRPALSPRPARSPSAGQRLETLRAQVKKTDSRSRPRGPERER